MNKLTKQLIGAGAGLSLLASSVMPVFAVALGDKTGQTTLVNQGVNAGLLTLESPEAVTMDDVTVSTAAQTVGGGAFTGDGATNEANNWKVDDARGHKPSSVPGWSLTATALDFSDGAGSTIDVTNMTVTPNDAEVLAPAVLGEMTLGGATSLLDDNDDGNSDAATVATAPALGGRGRYQGDLGLTLVVPANTDAADYSTTITFTVS